MLEKNRPVKLLFEARKLKRKRNPEGELRQPKSGTDTGNCDDPGCDKCARGAAGRCVAHGGGRRYQEPGYDKSTTGEKDATELITCSGARFLVLVRCSSLGRDPAFRPSATVHYTPVQ